MTRNLFALGWLLLFWFGLWRDLSAANLATGIVAAGTLLVVFPLPTTHQRLALRPIRLLRLVGTVGWSVAKANLVVAWEVITPRNRIQEGVVAVPLPTRDPIVITIVSHAIVLAPGTMVIDITRDPSTVLFVHVLHLRSADAVRGDVQALERVTSAALGARGPQEGRRTDP